MEAYENKILIVVDETIDYDKIRIIFLQLCLVNNRGTPVCYVPLAFVVGVGCLNIAIAFRDRLITHLRFPTKCLN